MGGPQSPNGRSFTQHCHRHYKRRNLLDGSSKLALLQQAVTFHLLKQAATSSLLCSKNKAPARRGRRERKDECSKLLFGKAMLQHSCFAPWVSWCAGFGVRFHDQNGTYVLLGWWCVLSMVTTSSAMPGGRGGGRGCRRADFLRCSQLFWGQIPIICHHIHRSAMTSFPKVLVAARRERCWSSESQQQVTKSCLMSPVTVMSRTEFVPVATPLYALASLKMYECFTACKKKGKQDSFFSPMEHYVLVCL